MGKLHNSGHSGNRVLDGGVRAAKSLPSRPDVELRRRYLTPLEISGCAHASHSSKLPSAVRLSWD